MIGILRFSLLSGAVCLSLAAQAPRPAVTISAAAASEDVFLRQLRASSQPSLMVFGEMPSRNSASDPSPSLFALAAKLIKEEEVVDLGIRVTNHITNFGQLAETTNALRRRFGFGQNIKWAVVDSNEQVLASGGDLPTAPELAQMLAAKGVQSPIRSLREFLKTRPGHLDARYELMRLQQASAGRRTKEALNLEVEDRPLREATAAEGAAARAAAAMGGGTFTASIRMSQTGGGGSVGPQIGSSLFPGRPQAPTPIPRDKILDAETDLQIWAGFADSLDRLFTGDDWIEAGVSFDNNSELYEICSPLVQGLYGRKIRQAEAALEMAPASPRLWSVWIRMAEVLGGRSILAVASRLAQMPGSTFSSWPEDVRARMTEEARATSKWDFIADSLWAQYEATIGELISISGSMVSSDAPSAMAMDISRQINEMMWTQQWDTLFEPLLEALLFMNDGRADTIMNALHERQKKGQWSESQMAKAVGLANRCGRPEIARQWSAYLSENK